MRTIWVCEQKFQITHIFVRVYNTVHQCNNWVHTGVFSWQLYWPTTGLQWSRFHWKNLVTRNNLDPLWFDIQTNNHPSKDPKIVLPTDADFQGLTVWGLLWLPSTNKNQPAIPTCWTPHCQRGSWLGSSAESISVTECSYPDMLVIVGLLKGLRTIKQVGSRLRGAILATMQTFNAYKYT